MTAEDLQDLQLPEEAVERLLQLHAAQLDALRTERDSLRQTLSQWEARRQAEQHTRTVQAVREALIRRGAHPQAAALLADRCTGAALSEEGELINEEALVAALQEEWSGLFLHEERLGTEALSPPCLTDGRVTRESLAAMSPEEINRRWPLIRDSL